MTPLSSVMSIHLTWPRRRCAWPCWTTCASSWGSKLRLGPFGVSAIVSFSNQPTGTLSMLILNRAAEIV
jgi:hypothetical protein